MGFLLAFARLACGHSRQQSFYRKPSDPRIMAAAPAYDRVPGNDTANADASSTALTSSRKASSAMRPMTGGGRAARNIAAIASGVSCLSSMRGRARGSRQSSVPTGRILLGRGVGEPSNHSACPRGARSSSEVCPHEPCEIGRARGYFDHLSLNCRRRRTRWRSKKDSNPRIWTQPRSQAARSTKVKPVAFVYTASVRSSVICSGP